MPTRIQILLSVIRCSDPRGKIKVTGQPEKVCISGEELTIGILKSITKKEDYETLKWLTEEATEDDYEILEHLKNKGHIEFR